MNNVALIFIKRYLVPKKKKKILGSAEKLDAAKLAHVDTQHQSSGKCNYNHSEL